jgi:hypothetical protein
MPQCQSVQQETGGRTGSQPVNSGDRIQNQDTVTPDFTPVIYQSGFRTPFILSAGMSEYNNSTESIKKHEVFYEKNYLFADNF